MSTKNKTNITVEPGKQELFITREFDAPRELVFKAYTDPELYAQWLGPRDLTTRFETFEPFGIDPIQSLAAHSPLTNQSNLLQDAEVLRYHRLSPAKLFDESVD